MEGGRVAEENRMKLHLLNDNRQPHNPGLSRKPPPPAPYCTILKSGALNRTDLDHFNFLVRHVDPTPSVSRRMLDL